MAKKEVKQSKKEIIDKIIKTVEILITPATMIGAVWGFDIAVYVSAVAGAIVGILTCVQTFIK